ncbi:class A beta-lactamase [Phenylobacterium sp.]|uniref:class A beta-lactamase n=1 Tax=Phenylobacterium sp. TaxID=1871053 RepID=UPI0035AE5BCC
MVARRNLLVGLGASGLGLAAGGGREGLALINRASCETPRILTNPDRLLADLERDSGGRLGVAVYDLQTRRRYSHRGQERFPMCSTFKLVAAAAVLARVDKGQEDLGRRIVYDPSVLKPYSPVTKAQVGPPGMTVADLCAAAVTVSDNTAGNLILEAVGGPQGLTAWVRSLGDKTTRLDRWEVELNTAVPGDVRDTTSPDAMLYLVEKLTLGNALSTASRDRLVGWMVANTTGDHRLRAGLPAGWRVGDKTGSGDNRTTNDVAVIWPQGRKPLIISAYLTEGPAGNDARNAVLASVARIVAGTL